MCVKGHWQKPQADAEACTRRDQILGGRRWAVRTVTDKRPGLVIHSVCLIWCVRSRRNPRGPSPADAMEHSLHHGVCI